MVKDTVTIPTQLVPEFEAWGRMTARLFRQLRQLSTQMPLERVGDVKRPDNIPEDQAWFWSDEWQARELKADEALARGEYKDFDNVEDAINHLRHHV